MPETTTRSRIAHLERRHEQFVGLRNLFALEHLRDDQLNFFKILKLNQIALREDRLLLVGRRGKLILLRVLLRHFLGMVKRRLLFRLQQLQLLGHVNAREERLALCAPCCPAQRRRTP